MCKYSQLSLNTFARSAAALMHTHQRVGSAAAERVKVFKLSFEYLHIYSSKVAIFAEKNSRIASLMFCQRSGLRKTLKILVSTAKTSKCFSLAVESKLLKKLLLNGTSAQRRLIAFRCAIFDFE